MENKKKPNILVIFGDDIGYWNLSCYNQGMMGYSTPNIDRLAKEGAKFTDYYGQQSCTAGRAAFITGQSPFRTGLTKVGLPGAKVGLQHEDATLAELLKPLGYHTGQFGKNHFGDRDEYLPTNHGFDEFFGNLYHLNAEEEPENSDYPKKPEFKEKYGPRGVIKSFAEPDGSQTIHDTGPLTKKRMETVDNEFLEAACSFIERAKDKDEPFFVWFNTTRMHNFTHVGEEFKGKSGLGFYADGMMEHDANIGNLLNKLDELELTEDTLVIYTTDNGPMISLWPDAAMTPFRGEKNTGYEGAFRVPCLVRWPGKIEAGKTFSDIFAGEDWLPTLLAIAGESEIKEKLKSGYDAGNKHFKVHLDGYNQSEMLLNNGTTNRKEFFYFSDDGDLLAIRYDRVKMHFMVQKAKGIDVWREPFVPLRAPVFYDLKIDPFERGDEGIGYNRWWYERVFLAVPAQDAVAKFLDSFRDFPPRQKPSSFTVDNALTMIENSATAGAR